MINLKKYPVGEIRPEKPKSASSFVVRLEKQLPLKMKGMCEEVLIDEVKSVTLYAICTKQRTLGYVVKIGGKPKIVSSWNHLYIFYGNKVSSVRLVYQDSDVRLTKSGNGKFVGFVIRARSQEEPTEEILENEK